MKINIPKLQVMQAVSYGLLPVFGLVTYFLYRKFIYKSPEEKLADLYTKANSSLDTTVDVSKLPHELSYYKALADGQEKALEGFFVDYSLLLRPFIDGLNSEEYKALKKSFGTRFDLHHFGSFDLIGWYTNKINNIYGEGQALRTFWASHGYKF